MSAVRATGLIAVTLLWLSGCVRPPADHPAFDDTGSAVVTPSGRDEPTTADAAGEDDAFLLRDIPAGSNALPDAGERELPTDADITDFDENEPLSAEDVAPLPAEPDVPDAAATPPKAGGGEQADGGDGKPRSTAAAGSAPARSPSRPSSRTRRSAPAARPDRSRARAAAPPARPGPPASSVKPDNDLERKAREIKARRGKQFSDPKWQREFREQGWYQANPEYSDAHLSPTERERLKRIRGLQEQRGEKAAR
jgi:hypothetical protein